MARFIRVTHRLPGRLRLRFSWLREEAAVASQLADRLAPMDGMVRVTVRPRTGSVLCEYDAMRLDEKRIIAAIRRETKLTRVLQPEEPEPETPRPKRMPSRGSVARSLSEILGRWNQDLLQTTEGRLDLGSATAIGLLGVGLAEVVTMRQVAAPPWFNLAWWAFRTLTIFDDEPAS